jgi:formamidopyrimidine-DNA glycosylase
VVAGIGNAYSDEICFYAGIHPFKKRASLSTRETDRLHEAIQNVLREAIITLRERVGTNIHHQVRDFLPVHGKDGEPCPVCSARIAEIRARGRLTNFCRTCQPGGLFRT